MAGTFHRIEVAELMPFVKVPAPSIAFIILVVLQMLYLLELT